MADPPHDTGQKAAPLPSETSSFPFSCRCSNLRVNGRIAKSDEQVVSNGNSDSLRIYLPKHAEYVRLAGYITYDEGVEVSEDSENQDDTRKSLWRKCWLCNVRCYQAEGKVKDDPATTEEWVTIDFKSGIVHGDERNKEIQSSLPFRKLRLEGPHTTSNFGRPPSNSALSLYPAPGQSPETNHLIPPPHDPFFLPPPFIPNHSHLRELCNAAGGYLRESHKTLEDEVKRYISSKAQEMRELEESVRGEVEMLWEKYKDGPGKGEIVERSRSASINKSGDMSRPISKDRSLPTKEENDNPLARATSSTNLPATSLLAQSLSANTFYAPSPSSNQPASVKDEIEKSLNHVASTYDKRDDSRAVAMSYVFSNLADHMGSSSTAGTSQTKRRSSSKGSGETVPDKDSWIDEERATLRTLNVGGKMSDVEEEDGEGRTPRPSAGGELQRREEKGKGRSKVTFEEPEPEIEKKDEPDLDGECDETELS
ncbi:uncharacterized protein IL334_005300 [Kwoniella shivajii]|uniref:Uncharacterized protein n=1 Tax=Kwoniella shivajii TaxID=564305 RepID=A0ABZ1D485_9TREE|nr:hypothetical protein IL334_005300 [Kwoniella shivajii]